MDSPGGTERKCSRITKNPFFNFLRCFRALPQNQYKPAQYVSRDGAKAWKRLTEDERDIYRKMAEPFLKHPRPQSRSCTSSSQPSTGTRRRQRRRTQQRTRSSRRRTQRTVNRVRTRKSRSRTIGKRSGRIRSRRHNSGIRRLKRRRPVRARPKQKLNKNLCLPMPALKLSKATPQSEDHPSSCTIRQTEDHPSSGQSCPRQRSANTVNEPPAKDHPSSCTIRQTEDHPSSGQTSGKTVQEPSLPLSPTTSSPTKFPEQSSSYSSCYMTTSKPESRTQSSQGKVYSSAGCDFQCGNRDLNAPVSEAPVSSNQTPGTNVDCCRLYLKEKDKSDEDQNKPTNQ